MRTWLANARKQKKFTHQQVADLAGIKRQYYGMIENGERTPSVGTAKKIAEILDFEWTLFFDNKRNKTLQTVITA
jgi:putative transcriptional regulator